MSKWAAIMRVSRMGDRKPGDENMHADREQLADFERFVSGQPEGATFDVIEEFDVSGRLPYEQREGLMKAIHGVESGRYVGVVVAYMSRFGRNAREQLNAWDHIEKKAGGLVHVIQGNIDSRTKEGRMMRTVLLAQSEYEGDVHAERFDNLREWATAAGIWQRRQTPLGYSKDPDTRKLVPNSDARTVKTGAFQARASGASISQVARTLGMTTSGARQLLRNRVYLGELRVGGRKQRDGTISPLYVNPAAHPPLVDEDLWRGAQSPRSIRPARAAAEPALLAALVRCTGCGHLMSPSLTVYACHGRMSAGQCPEPAAITMRRLDEHVEDIALREMADMLYGGRVVHGGDRVEEARAALAAAKRELATYLEAVSAADVGAEEFGRGARLRRDAVNAAQADLERALAARDASHIDADVIRRYPSLSVEHRSRLLRRIIETVLVERVGRGRLVPLDDRVRVIRAGTGLAHGRHRGGGAALPIGRIDLPDLDDPRVLRV